MDSFDHLWLREPVGPYFRAWTTARGHRVYNGWLDDLCDAKGGCHRYRRNRYGYPPYKTRTLRSHRDGSAARHCRTPRPALQ